jgi:hypothetical protein
MKITLTELKQVIREVIAECYGWPVESKKPLYGINSDSLGKPSPHDGKNSALRFPRGPNSRQKGRVNESFSKITAKELKEWQSGNWGYLHEDAVASECSECGGARADKNGMVPEGMYECDCG